MGQKTFRFIYIFLFSLFFTDSKGQIKKFIPFNKYTQSEGLSSYNVTRILKDKYGFIWVGTQDGINRFDGKNYLVFSSDSKNHRHFLQGSNVSDIVEDTATGLLWVATTYGGITGIDLKTQSIVTRISSFENQQLSEKWIRCLNVVDNIIWFGTDKEAYAFDLNKKEYLKLQLNERFETSISKIIVDHLKRVWLFSDKGIFIVNSRTGSLQFSIPLEKINFYNETKSFNAREIIQIDQNILIASTWGLRKITYDATSVSILNWMKNTRFSKEEVYSFSIIYTDQLWISTMNGLFEYDSNHNNYSRILDTESKLDGWQSAVYSIYKDDNCVWIGSQEGLANLKPENQTFTNFFKSIETELKIQHAYSLLPVNDSIIYCGTNDGFYVLNSYTRVLKKIISGTSFYLTTILPDKNILVSSDQGIFVLQNSSLIPANKVYPILNFLKNDLLNSAVNFNDSVVIFGSQTQKGIYQWNIKANYVLQINSANKNLALENNILNALYKASVGKILILTDNVIEEYNPKNKTIVHHKIYMSSGKAASIFYDICETKNSYWIAAYGTGLVEVDKKFNLKRIISSASGLCNNGVYKVFTYRDSLIFITSNNGMSLLNINTNQIKNYYKADGLHSNSFEAFCGAAYLDKIYAGGVNGFTIIDPNKIHENRVKPVLYFNNIEIDTKSGKIDTANIFLREINIPNNFSQVRISFTGLNYINPLRTTYKYQIKELHTDWINLNNDNAISLIGISPGTYHLQVQAFNEDGIASDIKELTLTFTPKWYQTWWFKVLIVLIVLAIVYGLYRMRINHLKKEEKIRNQVAGDLHDELGSTLNSVKIFTNLALMEKENTSHLEKIKEATQSAISGVKDIIWVLDDKRDTLDHLLGRINQFARPICEAAGISYKQQSGGNENYKLGKEEKRNLYMIIKESINNSIKYGECSVIELLIKNNGAKLSVSVSDDGKGFDKNEIVSGYGLKNIMRRSEEINYHAEINSSPGNGTLIYLEKK